MSATLAPLPHARIRVDHNNYKESVLEILASVKPHWKQEDIEIIRTSQGHLNTLLKCSVDSGEQPVIVRIFGETSGFDRDAEIQVLRFMGHHGICAKYHCRFDNGVVYDFIKGRTLSRKELHNEALLKKVAENLHVIQQLDLNDPHLGAAKRTNIGQLIGIKLKAIEEENFETFLNSESYTSMMLPPLNEMKEMYQEISDYWSYLSEHYPMLFCHGDFQVQNIIYDEDTGDMSSVDWELSCLAPSILDAAILIDRDPEFGSEFHDPANRRQWLQCYLSTHPVHGTQPITEQMLQQWYKDSLRASCVSVMLSLMFLIELTKVPTARLDCLSLLQYFYNLYRKYQSELNKLDEVGEKTKDIPSI